MMLRLIMGISADGYVSRGISADGYVSRGISADGYVSVDINDDMSWLGPDDKRAFRLLTVAGSGVCGVSAVTAACMPRALPGRLLYTISRRGLTLEAFREMHYEACLLGGQTLALAALADHLVDVVHLCRSDRVLGCKGQVDLITPLLQSSRWWALEVSMRIGDTVVETWRQTAVRRL